MKYAEEKAQLAKDQFEALIAHTNKLLSRARSIYYSLFLANLAALIAVLSTRDIHFFSSSRSLKLPIIGVEVDTFFFFFVAPALLLGTFICQQYYFTRLMTAFVDGPLRREISYGVPLVHRIGPWIVSDYFMSVAAGSKSGWKDWLTGKNVVFILSFVISTWLTPFTLCYFWLYSFTPHHPGLSLFLQSTFCISIGLCAWICAMRSQWIKYRGWNWQVSVLAFFIFSIPASVVTFDRAVGSWNGVRTQIMFPLYSADLANSQLTTQPGNWVSRDAALSSFLAKNYSTKQPDNAVACLKTSANVVAECYVDGVTETALKKFAAQREAFLRFLPKIDIEGADLRNARLEGSFMPGVRASGADFRGADLRGAVMEGGNFVDTMFGRADLSFADINNSDISKARIDGAKIPGANFHDLDANSIVNPKLLYPRFFQCAYGDTETTINTKNYATVPVRPLHWSSTELIQSDVKEDFRDWRDELLAYLKLKDAKKEIVGDLKKFKQRPPQCKRPMPDLVPMFQIPTWMLWIGKLFNV